MCGICIITCYLINSTVNDLPREGRKVYFSTRLLAYVGPKYSRNSDIFFSKKDNVKKPTKSLSKYCPSAYTHLLQRSRHCWKHLWRSSSGKETCCRTLLNFLLGRKKMAFEPHLDDTLPGRWLKLRFSPRKSALRGRCNKVHCQCVRPGCYSTVDCSFQYQ